MARTSFSSVGGIAAPGLAAMLLLGVAASILPAAEDDKAAQEIARLVRQLNDDRAVSRDEAEQALLEMAGDNAAENDRFLELLPQVTDQMPPAVRDRLTRLRQQVEKRTAKAAAKATSLTLQARDMPLADVIKAVESQTGNRLVDNRAEFGQEAVGTSLTLDFNREPFWPAVDQILDQANLGVYNYAGEDALALVAREPGERSRFGSAYYSGPFRFEVLEIQAQRNLRQPQRKSLKVQLEIAWEPRLRPIALLQPLADISATGEDGYELQPSNQLPVLQVEVHAGNQATELILPFELPPREVTKIASLKGTLQALVPGRHVTFKFDQPAAAAGQSQRRGGVQVTLDTVRKNNEIWEVHMRMKFDDPSGALESHRGWVFQNVTYMVDENGEPIDHIGLETTLQTKSEVGMAYLFDVPGNMDGLSWVYETPAAIVTQPVKFEMKNVELP